MVVAPFVDKDKNKVPGIVSFHKNKERHIRCEFCREFPHIVKQYVPQKPPAITTIQGTRYYSRTLTYHLDTQYHKECSKSHRIKSTELKEAAPMDVAINKATKSQIDKVGKLMIQVYLDAKRLNLPPHSWPSRYVAGEASHAYDSSNQSKSVIADNIDLQYVNKPGHSILMKAIVESHFELFSQKIKDCLAFSLRVDGSVDFTQIDKIYVLGKLVNKDGTSELIFIGIAAQTERKAEGLMKAVENALQIHTCEAKEILCKLSSICTDGTNVNSGEEGGLWALLEKKMQNAGSTIPLIKIWCAAHRAELAWKNAADLVKEVNKVFSVLSKMSTHFHHSGDRTTELKKIASEHKIRVMNLPKIFEIRWTEFTLTLVRSVLNNCFMACFDDLLQKK